MVHLFSSTTGPMLDNVGREQRFSSYASGLRRDVLRPGAARIGPTPLTVGGVSLQIRFQGWQVLPAPTALERRVCKCLFIVARWVSRGIGLLLRLGRGIVCWLIRFVLAAVARSVARLCLARQYDEAPLGIEFVDFEHEWLLVNVASRLRLLVGDAVNGRPIFLGERFGLILDNRGRCSLRGIFGSHNQPCFAVVQDWKR
jgi:hypothetical protein